MKLSNVCQKSEKKVNELNRKGEGGKSEKQVVRIINK